MHGIVSLYLVVRVRYELSVSSVAHSQTDGYGFASCSVGNSGCLMDPRCLYLFIYFVLW